MAEAHEIAVGRQHQQLALAIWLVGRAVYIVGRETVELGFQLRIKGIDVFNVEVVTEAAVARDEGIPLARFEDAESAAVPLDVGVPGHAERRGKAQQTGEKIHRGVEIRHVHERGDLEELSRHGSDHAPPTGWCASAERKAGTPTTCKKKAPISRTFFRGLEGIEAFRTPKSSP